MIELDIAFCQHLQVMKPPTPSWYLHANFLWLSSASSGDEQWTKLDYRDELRRCTPRRKWIVGWGEWVRVLTFSRHLLRWTNVYMHTVGRRWLVNVEIKEDRNFVMRSVHVTHPRGMSHAMYIIYITFCRVLILVKFMGLK